MAGKARGANGRTSVAYVMAGSGETRHLPRAERPLEPARAVFYDAGLRFGDHIAVLMENRLEYFEVCWAAQRSGLFYTCINSHFNADEVAYILDDCDAQVLVDLRHVRATSRPSSSTRCRT